MRGRIAVRAAGALVLVFGLSSCTLFNDAERFCCTGDEPLYKPHTVHWQEDAGEVHIARGSIALWQNYVDTLQPSFTITPTAALAAALPTTSYTKEALASSFNFGAQIGLPQTTETLSNSTSLSNGTPTTSSSNATATNPGTLPTSQYATATMPSASGLPVPSGTLGQDAILQYTAATAIYQEVQLLNNYLKDAAFLRDATPYMLRLSVNAEPYARGEPYDIYIDASVFTFCNTQNNTEKSKSQTVFRPQLVSVIPLLVTDDVETSQGTNASDQARQLAATLGGTIQNVAFQTQLQDLIDHYQSIFGTDTNSLFTVTRGGSDNVFRVRIGAAANVAYGYSMATQTHNVTLVVAVPKALQQGECNGTPELQIVSTSAFRDATSGKKLGVDPGKLDDALGEVLKRFVPAISDISKNDLDNLGTLASDIAEDNYQRFVHDAITLYPNYPGHKGITRSRTQALWTGLSTVVAKSEYASTYVDLPEVDAVPLDGYPLSPPSTTEASAAPTSPSSNGPNIPYEFKSAEVLEKSDSSTSSSQSVGKASVRTIIVPQMIVLTASGTTVTTSVAGLGSTPTAFLQARLECDATDVAGNTTQNLTIPATAVTHSDPSSPFTVQFGAIDTMQSLCEKKGTPTPATRKKGTPNPATSGVASGDDCAKKGPAQPAATPKVARKAPKTRDGLVSPAQQAPTPKVARKAAKTRNASASPAKPPSDDTCNAPKPWAGVKLVIDRSDGDPRWKSSINITSYEFNNVYSVEDTSSGAGSTGGFTLAAGTDTLMVGNGGTATLRLMIDKLDATTMTDVLVTAFGAAIAGGTVVSLQSPPGTPATVPTVSFTAVPGEVEITPAPTPQPGAASSTQPPKGPTIFDVALSGLVPKHSVTITATTEPKEKGAAPSKQSVTVSVEAQTRARRADGNP